MPQRTIKCVEPGPSRGQDHDGAVSQHATTRSARQGICMAVEGVNSSDAENQAMAEAAISGHNVFTAMWRKRFAIPRCCDALFDMASQSPHTRVYQVWPGKNVFFFRGKMICGPDPRGLILTIVSILLSDWIFCAYISNPSLENSAFQAKLSIVLTIIVIVNLLLASTRDPGIVPRNEKSPLQVGTGTAIRSKRVILDGVPIRIKYCRICKIFPPPRSSHCIICDNCVEKFDHHCPWISQCVGLRNYRHYLVFVVSALIFFIYILIFSCMRIRRVLYKTKFGLLALLRHAPEAFLLALFSFMAVWFLGGLLIFHAYLITLNQTAHENFKGKYSKTPNPYDKGIMSNMKEAFFKRLPASKIDFQAVIEPNWGAIARMLMSSTNGTDTQVTTSGQHADENKQTSIIPPDTTATLSSTPT